ncbi:MAG: signal recognition particle-docking protein FtsY [Candidatus Aminicenantales bacterium]
MGIYNLFIVIGSLRDKLAKTRQAFIQKFDAILKSGRRQEEILDELAETLILADVGVATTEKIISAIARNTKKTDPFETVEAVLKAELAGILSKYPGRPALGPSPGVLMMVGVNGGGKTTSLAKLARRFGDEGKKCLFVAADTFRAAAQEQLAVWGKRLNVPVVKGSYGADPASVVFDAARRFKAQGFDYMLVDTAGRIHTNTNLMNELDKIKRVIAREIEGAPQEILLVLDASIGQNALPQAREFMKFSGITGIFLTKLDGTAKGGSVIGIADQLALPIKYVGTGESEDEILEFSADRFVDALLT